MEFLMGPSLGRRLLVRGLRQINPGSLATGRRSTRNNGFTEAWECVELSFEAVMACWRCVLDGGFFVPSNRQGAMADVGVQGRFPEARCASHARAAIMRPVKFARPPLVQAERPTLALGGNTALEERPDCKGRRRS